MMNFYIRKIIKLFAWMIIIPQAALAVPKPSDSWSKLRSNLYVEIRQSPLHEAFGPHGYFNSCIDPVKKQLQTRKPLSTCVQFKTNYVGFEALGDVPTCVKTVQTHVSIPIERKNKICINWSKDARCLQFKTVSISLSNEPEFHVLYTTPYNETNEHPGIVVEKKLLFKKKFQIPSCEGK